MQILISLFLKIFSLSLHPIKTQKEILMRNRFILSFLFVFVALGLQAQSKSVGVKLLSDVPNKTATQKQADTVANTAVKTQTAEIAGFYNSVAIQVELNRISGTAGGKVILMGSLNGTSFEKSDSITVLNLPQQTKIFQLVPSKYVFYRVQYTGAGTMSVALKSLAVARKQ